jgi:hypothetical protein
VGVDPARRADGQGDVEPGWCRRREQHVAVERLEPDVLLHGRGRHRLGQVAHLVAEAVAQAVLGLGRGARPGPLAEAILVVRHAAPVDGGGAPAAEALGDLDPHDHGAVVLDAAVAAQLDAVVGEAGHGQPAALGQEHAGADAGDGEEGGGRGREHHQRHRAGAEEEAAADDAARAEDALDLDPLRPIVGVLEQEVVLHLAPEVEQDEGPGRGQDEAEEGDAVGEVGVEDRAGHQHEETQEVQLQPVAGGAPVVGLGHGQPDQELGAGADEVAGGRPGQDDVGQGQQRGQVPGQGPALDPDPGRLPPPRADQGERAAQGGDGADTAAADEGEEGAPQHGVAGDLVRQPEAH